MSALNHNRIISGLESAECHMQSNLQRAVGNEGESFKHTLETIQWIRERAVKMGNITVISHSPIDTVALPATTTHEADYVQEAAE